MNDEKKTLYTYKYGIETLGVYLNDSITILNTSNMSRSNWHLISLLHFNSLKKLIKELWLWVISFYAGETWFELLGWTLPGRTPIGRTSKRANLFTSLIWLCCCKKCLLFTKCILCEPHSKIRETDPKNRYSRITLASTHVLCPIVHFKNILYTVACDHFNCGLFFNREIYENLCEAWSRPWQLI